MFNVEIPKPENGAAYQILFERTQPAYCNTRVRQAEIHAEFAIVMEWAKTQPVPVWQAYDWAVRKILEDVEANMKRNELANGVQHHLQTMPRPPGGPLPYAPASGRPDPAVVSDAEWADIVAKAEKR